MPISFYSEVPGFNFKGRRIFKKCVMETLQNEGKTIGNLNYIFVEENKILDINHQYLKHDYVTDIITFDYCENNQISGDLFLCIPCIRQNAQQYGVSFGDELLRVMAHGVLHLVGYQDKTPKERAVMTTQEDTFLALYARNMLENSKQTHDSEI